MWEFVRENWRMLLLTSLALLVAGFCLFSPPTLIAELIIGIASSPLFSVFGPYAGYAASATVALFATAGTFVLGTVVNSIANFFTSVFVTLFANNPSEKRYDDNEEDCSSLRECSPGLSQLASRDVKVDHSHHHHEERDHGYEAPFSNPRKKLDFDSIEIEDRDLKPTML